MGIRERLIARREAVLATAARHGARNVRIFGSVARGQSHNDSDLDVLVSMDRGRSLLDLVALGDEWEALLGCRVDVVTDAGLSPYLRERVCAEAVSV